MASAITKMSKATLARRRILLPKSDDSVTGAEKRELLESMKVEGGPFDDNSDASRLFCKLLKMDIDNRPDQSFERRTIAKSLEISPSQLGGCATHIRKILKAYYFARKPPDAISVSFPPRSYRPIFKRHQASSQTETRIKYAIESWNGPRVWEEVIRPCEQKWRRGKASILELSSMAAALIQAAYWGDRPATDLRRKAITASQEAVDKLTEADSNELSSIAYLGRACVAAVFERRFDVADRGFRKAIQTYPTNPFARSAYATNVLSPTQRLSEAVNEAKLALSADQRSPFTNSSLAWMYFYSGLYDLAIKHWRGALHYFSDGFSPKYGLACTFGERHDWDQCFAMFNRILKRWPKQPYITALVGHYKARQKDIETARSILRFLTASNGKSHISPYGLALVHAGLGELDEAFQLLNLAEREHDVRLTYIDIAPAWRSLRDDKRYQVLCRRLRLPQFQSTKKS